jgi:hypothetical protein
MVAEKTALQTSGVDLAGVVFWILELWILEDHGLLMMSEKLETPVRGQLHGQDFHTLVVAIARRTIPIMQTRRAIEIQGKAL